MIIHQTLERGGGAGFPLGVLTCSLRQFPVSGLLQNPRVGYFSSEFIGLKGPSGSVFLKGQYFAKRGKIEADLEISAKYLGNIMIASHILERKTCSPYDCTLCYRICKVITDININAALENQFCFGILKKAI